MASTNLNSTGQPLFIVDRDWLRQGSKTRKSWTGNVRNRSLYGLAIQVTQYDVPGIAARRKSQTKAKRRRRDKQGDATDSESQGEPEKIPQQHNPPIPTERHQSVSAAISYNHDIIVGDDIAVLDPVYNFDSWPGNPSLHPPISSGFPGLECIKGLECYLDYYLDVIGTAQHPIETRFRLQSNAIRSSWFPLAFEDDLWLQNITLFSAFHHASNQNTSPPEGVNALMSSFLSQLNERISRSDLSDGTIASVSCLTMSEHIKGNNQLAKVHATGMSEMVRLRGGLHTIERARRSKIFRADIVRSADTLEPPLLPRLPRAPLPVGSGLKGPGPRLTAAVTKMSHSDISRVLISVVWTLGSICESLEAAWEGRHTLDATSYYEHVLCLNHDLLTFGPQSAFDEALKLSIINFTQPMFRYCAFTETSCQLRAKRLRSALEQLYLEQYDQDVLLWMVFNGYMNSQQTLEHGWFKTRLTIAFEERQPSGILIWQDLKVFLQNFLWTDSIHDQFGKHFFDSYKDDKQRPSPHLNDMCITCSGASQSLDANVVVSRNALMSSAKASENCQIYPCPA